MIEIVLICRLFWREITFYSIDSSQNMNLACISIYLSIFNFPMFVVSRVDILHNFCYIYSYVTYYLMLFKSMDTLGCPLHTYSQLLVKGSEANMMLGEIWKPSLC